MISNRGYVINYDFQDSGKPRILKEETNHGYKRVSLFFNGKKYHKRIHRLVAEAFVTNPKPKKFNIVHHKDNIKTHN